MLSMQQDIDEVVEHGTGLEVTNGEGHSFPSTVVVLWLFPPILFVHHVLKANGGPLRSPLQITGVLHLYPKQLSISMVLSSAIGWRSYSPRPFGEAPQLKTP